MNSVSFVPFYLSAYVCPPHTRDGTCDPKPRGLFLWRCLVIIVSFRPSLRQLFFSRLELWMLRAASPQQAEQKITDGTVEEFPVVSEAVEFLKLYGRENNARPWAFPAHLVIWCMELTLRDWCSYGNVWAVLWRWADTVRSIRTLTQFSSFWLCLQFRHCFCQQSHHQ